MLAQAFFTWIVFSTGISRMAVTSEEAAKTEVQRQVTEFIIEPLCALFDELFALSQQQDGRLLTFQMHLKAIPKWSAVTVAKWVDKVEKACNCFEELVAALFLSHIKLLSSIRLNQATLKVKIPRNEKFIHAVMILAAKDFYENPKIFRHKAQADKAKVLSYAVNKTVRDMLPMKDLLQEYLAPPKPVAAPAAARAAGTHDPSLPDVQVEAASEEPVQPTAAAAAATMIDETWNLAGLANESVTHAADGETVMQSEETADLHTAAAATNTEAAAAVIQTMQQQHREEQLEEVPPFQEEIKHIHIFDKGAPLQPVEEEEEVQEQSISAEQQLPPPQNGQVFYDEADGGNFSEEQQQTTVEGMAFPRPVQFDKQPDTQPTTEEVMLDNILMDGANTATATATTTTAATAAANSHVVRQQYMNGAFFSDAEL